MANKRHVGSMSSSFSHAAVLGARNRKRTAAVLPVNREEIAVGKKYCDWTPEQKRRAAETRKVWMEDHPTKATEYAYKYRAQHLDEYREYQREYYRAHKEKYLEYNRRYRAKKKAMMEAANDSV